MKILIIRFSSIGDIVLSSALIRCLRMQMPKDTIIHYLTKASYKSLLEFNPHLNKVYTIHESVNEITSELKKEKYDKILDLHTNLRSYQTTLTIGKLASRLYKWNAAKWRMVKLKKKLIIPPIALRYINTAELLGIEYDNKGLDFFIPKSITYETIGLKIPELFELTKKNIPYVVIIAGGKFKTKCLPVNKMRELLISISRPVIVIGGNEDEENVANAIFRIPNIINACGKLSILESAWVVDHSFKVISHDTGLMHIACAMNKPLTVIWGNTVPEFGFSPFKPLGIESETFHLQVENLSCRPCSKIGFNACPKSHFDCMNKLNFTQLIQWTNN